MAKIAADITESYLAELGELLESARKDVLDVKASPGDAALLSRLLRTLHTIKGNSRMLGYQTIEKLAHSVEDLYKSIKDGRIKNSDRLVRVVFFVLDKIAVCSSDIRKKGFDTEDIDLYLQYCDKMAAGELVDVDAMAAEIKKEQVERLSGEDEGDETIRDIQSIRVPLARLDDIIGSFDTMITREFRLKHQLDALRSVEEATGNHEIATIRKQFESDIFALETSIFGVQEQVFNLRMLPISIVLRPFESSIVLEATQMRKNVRADIPDTDIAIDKVILEQLNDILMHLVRNALDHGIELPAERASVGKPEQGTVSITCRRETKHIELRISDDGRGIDYDKVREKAIKQFSERADEIKEMGERELSQFIFMSGFSTKDIVTELSGRGVGLDVVWTNVEKIKGRVKVQSEKGKGTTFILTFPLSLSTMQGLFIYSNRDKFFISAQFIVDIIYRNRSEYVTLQNQNYIELEGQLIPVYSLSSLFKDQKGVRNLDADSILIAEYMEQRVGIIVDQVLHYTSLVVKRLPEAFKNFSILQGIVFDEHYDIVPILHVPDIIKKFRSLRGYDIKKYEAATKQRTVRILVVDDSDTTRQIETSILESGGFAVDTAVDGIDGLEKVRSKQFDLIVLDKDMPRMNGFVFMENLRRMEQYASVPVIVVSADQDRNIISQFEAAGVNAFIAKSDFKRGNLINAVKEFVHE